MLHYLSVQNFAIIENIEVHFQPGMTALTGETGAGKSLLIDAIGLLLGDRATSNIVRTGADKAIVEGIFYIDKADVLALLQDKGIDVENHEILIKRQITPTNNNIIKINQQTVSLKELREITSKLADIHTQMDTHRLIQQDTYLDIIDGFQSEQTATKLTKYREARAAYLSAWNEWQRLLHANQDLEERLDLMRFQQQELQSYHLQEGEEEDLNQAVDTMENFDKIYQSLINVKERLDEHDALGTIYDAAKELQPITNLHDDYKTLHDELESKYYDLYDLYETLTTLIGSLDFNPTLLDQHQERLDTLSKLKRKYRKSIPQIMEYLETITKDIENIDHYDDVLHEQEQAVRQAFDVALDAAKQLRLLRQNTARYIENTLLDILADLELPKTEFQIAFEPIDGLDPLEPSGFMDHGIDTVDFLLSTNIGEPMKPLAKSASGGEMSRIMLGFKNLLATSLHVDLMIFDEIDSGVSGYVAFQVAKKMKEIANQTQVLSITHIPQVAAISEHHLHISKEVKDGRTRAHIKAIHGEERIHEIASMISGDTVTKASMTSAKELLGQ